MKTQKKTLKVFISYSWDSENHKEAVRYLADTLIVSYGIEVIGDFYDEDNPPGGSLPSLMEKICECDKVICVLTPIYKIKADEMAGGVGYEKCIITNELYENFGSSKFIPITLSNEFTLNDCAPKFLTSARRALLRTAYETEEVLIKEIARAIHEMPKRPKPPIGKNKLLEEREDITVNDAEKIDISIITKPQNHETIFKIALYYAKNNNESNFRLLFRQVKKQVFVNLMEFQKKYQGKRLSEEDLNNLINIASPLFLVALSGCLSFNEKFNQQEGLLIDLLSSDEWDTTYPFGCFAELLAYIYHHIYGALCIDTDQFNNIIKIFEQKIPFSSSENEYKHLYKVPRVTAWITLLDDNCFIAFKYLLASYQRWGWVRLPFDNNENEFKKSLVCYQKIMNIFEYFCKIKNGNLASGINDHICVPPTFTMADPTIQTSANTLIIKKREFLKNYLKQNNIPEKTVMEQWPAWVEANRSQFKSFDYAPLMKNIFE